MKKFISLVLALVMALSLTTVAWGATTVEVAANASLDPTTISYTSGDTVKLTGDVTLTGLWTITDTVTLDLNGFELSRTGGNTVIFVSGSTAALTIKDSSNPSTGKVVGTDQQAVYVSGGTVTLESGTISSTKTADANPSNGVVVVTGATFIMNGGTVSSDTAAISGNGTAGQGGTTITINAGVVTSTGAGIYHPQTGTLNITGGTITGATGVYVKSGSVSITGGTISGTGTAANYTFNGDGCNPTGDALVVDSCNYPGGAPVVSVTGGTFTSANAAAVASYVGNGVADADKVDKFVEGGTFSGTVPAALLADDVQQLANGSVVTTPAASATDPVLYVWDNTAEDWTTYYIATGADLDDLKQGADEKCLPCFLIDGKYFVETKAAAATYKLVHGTKTVYLTNVAEKFVKYEAKASVLNVVETEDAECGDYHVATLGTKDVYYASYDKKTGLPNGFYKASKTSNKNVLVGDELVAVQVLTAGAVSFMDHDWVGYDVVNYEYTTVKCSECDNVAKLYKNATAAGKKAVKVVVDGDVLGWITAADAYNYGANAPVVTDKVESAETFDAGIAMYVGMSVMAAAGSAVVLKKKD